MNRRSGGNLARSSTGRALKAGLWIAAWALLLAPQVLLAYSEDLELALARGEYLFQHEEVARAGPYFDLCLQIEPEHGRANHYRGLCALEAGRYREAEDYLLRALEAEPGNPDVVFDLVRAYASGGSNQQAWERIEGLPDSVRRRPLVRYFEGVVQIGRRNYAEAIVVLEDVARLDHPEAIRASFYLGLAHDRLGNDERAREYYNLVLRQSDDARLVAEANRLVRRMERRARRGRDWWSVTGGAGIYYDDNVPLEPDEYDVTEEGGAVGRFWARAFFRPLRLDRGYLGAGGGLRYHVLLAGDEDLRDYDMLRAQVELATRWRLFRARLTGYGGLRFRYDYTALGQDLETYGHRVIVQPYFDLYETRWLATRLRYRATVRMFPDDEDRDGAEHEPGLVQFLFLTDRDGFVQFSGSGLFNVTGDDYYDFYGFHIEAALDIRMVWRAYLQASAGFEYRDYADHPGDRLDQRIALYGSVYLRPWEFLRVIADYRYTNNDSKARYAYERNIIGLAVEYRYQ